MSRYTPLPPQNFGGLPEEHSSYETSRAVIFPVPLERTATYERGTRNGPAAILEASRHMEMFDEELETDFSKKFCASFSRRSSNCWTRGNFRWRWAANIR
jgi:arginase family enzyme